MVEISLGAWHLDRFE